MEDCYLATYMPTVQPCVDSSASQLKELKEYRKYLFQFGITAFETGTYPSYNTRDVTKSNQQEYI